MGPGIRRWNFKIREQFWYKLLPYLFKLFTYLFVNPTVKVSLLILSLDWDRFWIDVTFLWESLSTSRTTQSVWKIGSQNQNKKKVTNSRGEVEKMIHWVFGPKLLPHTQKSSHHQHSCGFQEQMSRAKCEYMLLLLRCALAKIYGTHRHTAWGRIQIHTETHRNTDIQPHTHTQRNTDTQTRDTQTHRQGKRRHTDKHSNRHTETNTDIDTPA